VGQEQKSKRIKTENGFYVLEKSSTWKKKVFCDVV